MSMLIEAACLSLTGRVRRENQDRLYFAGQILPENGDLTVPLCRTQAAGAPLFLAVFDGMGGEANGALAAALAAEAFRDTVEGEDVPLPAALTEALLLGNRRICGEMARGLPPMGTTAVAACLRGEELLLTNIGDSPAFLLRRGSLTRLSAEHTEAALLSRWGVPVRKPRLTQFLGIPPEEMVIEPHTLRLALQPGDWLLLCSDGLTDMVPPAELPALLEERAPVARNLLRLGDEAMARGGRDNLTAILCRLSPPQP